MNESSMGGWAGLSQASPYGADNASLSSSQGMQNTLAGSGMGFSQPAVNTNMNSYGGGVAPSSVNGYPMFSSPTAGTSSPSGYVDTNPLDGTPSIVQAQARAAQQGMPSTNNNQATPPTSNPWNIRQSSSSGAFDYPIGQNSPPPKLNVL